MRRDGKGKFYRELFKDGALDKSIRRLIDFYNDWKRKAQIELDKRKQ